MLPQDALQQDWRMYYHNCWMEHTSLGVGLVSVVSTSFYFYQYPEDTAETNAIKVDHKCLRMWWPRPGAYNTTNGACYIARRSTRTMRKSAQLGDHYIAQSKIHPVMGGPNIMLLLRQGPNPVTIKYGLDVLDNKLSSSVAVTRDIILERNNDVTRVMFKGIEMGYMNRMGIFKPHKECALARRCQAQLKEAA